jgi:membrane peptidoglycan carboxypeptidase
MNGEVDRRAIEPVGEPVVEPAGPPASALPPRRRWRRWAIIVAVVALPLGVSGTAAGAYYASISLPKLSTLAGATTLYYADGKTVLARLGREARFVIDTRTLPAHVRAAVLSAEDRDFDKGGPAHRPSVIARQYARIEFDITGNNVRLLPMADKLERDLGKEKILDRYLNTVYFGRGAYGIEAAARAYFGKATARLTAEEAMVLAGVIESPGDGKFDPARNPEQARVRFDAVKAGMVDPLGVLSSADAARMRVPAVLAPEAGSRLVSTFIPSGPTGLVAQQVLAELRRLPPTKDKPAAFMGYQVVTTIESSAQQALERFASAKGSGSVLAGQPANLQAAAVAVQPKTGRVLAYYAGDLGEGSDYAHWYTGDNGEPTGYGFHPPGTSFAIYDLAEALRQGISLRSRWDAPPTRQLPRVGAGQRPPLTDSRRCPTGGTSCSLADSVTTGLSVPLYGLTERLGVDKVVGMARAAGVDSMKGIDGNRISLPAQTDNQNLRGLFTPDVGIGAYPITVLDHATGMATFAARGERAPAHFVASVSHGGTEVYREAPQTTSIGLTAAQLDDLTWALHQHRDARLVDGRSTAVVTGTWHMTNRVTEPAHAWIAGFTPQYGVAVWVGNRKEELPLKDRSGAYITGSTLPAQIYRGFLGEMLAGTPHAPVPSPAYGGDPKAGNAR